MAKRRRFTPEFKARVAMEALRGDKTTQEIAGRHQVHPNQVSAWKRQAVEGLSSVFERDGGGDRKDGQEVELKSLHAKIGELTVQNDFLSKALKL